MMRVNLQYFGGRGGAGGKRTGSSAGGTSPVDKSMSGKQLAESLSTDSEKRNWLRSLGDNEQWASIQDDRTIEFQKMEGLKKYIVTERGNRYNADGSYTPYNIGAMEVSEKVMLRYLQGTKSLRKRK